MRPAQLTPENGAIRRRADESEARFNEAGAINAGKLFRRVGVCAIHAVASMRPAQLTPENTLGLRLRRIFHFLLQ